MLDKITKLVSLISLCIAVYAAWIALPADREIKRLQAETARLDNALKQADADLKALASTREFSFALYKEVKTVIDSPTSSSRQEDAVRVLVESLADDPLRSKLLAVIATGAKNSEVKAAATATSRFFREQEQVSASALASADATDAGAGLEAMNVDFFYCESKEATSKQTVNAALRLEPANSMRDWRARLLPESINRQPSYQITSNVIRFNPQTERRAAKELAEALGTQSVSVQLQETDYPTPGYVSVFICQ